MFTGTFAKICIYMGTRGCLWAIYVGKFTHAYLSENVQEFWVGNEELVNMYEKRLGDAGYATYKLARTNNRGDGTIYLYWYFA